METKAEIEAHEAKTDDEAQQEQPPAQYQQAQAATEDVAPEVGPFGPILTQYYHDAQGAIKALTALQDGEAVAALHYPGVGDIDLVWGKEGTQTKDYEDGMGLAKIIKKHSEVLDDLQGFVSSLSIQKRSKTA